ncbi:unnamed protein product [Rhizoctonia solani]|uniref:Uncharacterized protein n=1 Tax=Rhizoctonia solani TaxID=456999 RepID=A0A8H3A1H6_9AGAM|nr:unnamed protein product [Rhizoctonia solani]
MSLAEVYNTLPTIGAANDAFTDREAMFAKLAPLLAAYQFQFGICLVHAHCTIKEGEAMVADGNITRPTRDGPQYPERWLADGTPYEFTREPTQVPPPELVRDFQAIVGKDTVLGLFHPSRDHDGKVAPDGKVWIEHTEGRKNIVELIDKDQMSRHMETAWIPGTDSPVTMVCHWICVKDPQAGHVADHRKAASED